MRKTLTYSSLLIASLVVIAVFLTATTYTQLGIAVLLYPLLAYFAFKLLPRTTWKAPAITIRFPASSAPKADVETINPKREQVEVADIDKRTFLKLIGAAGLSFFIFSLLGRRVETLLFGRSSELGMAGVENPTGDGIAGPEASPTGAYKISEIDDNIITYYGFTNASGGWLIMQEDTNTDSFRYAKGNSNFSGNWARREKLKYDYYHNLF